MSYVECVTLRYYVVKIRNMIKEYRYRVVSCRVALALLMMASLVACNSDAISDPTTVEESKPEKVTVRLTVDEGRSVGSAIHSIALCGSDFLANVTNPGHATNSLGTYELSNYDGARSFLFIANLTDADRATVQATELSESKNLVFNTNDYIPTATVTAPMPMTYMFRNVTWQELYVEQTRDTRFRCTRLFAVVDYNITFPSTSYQLVNVKVKNIPAKFSITEAIDDYDLTSNGYISYDLNTQASGKFFLPENKVSDPVFFDADDNGMTYMEVQYKDPATADQVHTAKFRIAEFYTSAYTNRGYVKRHNVYNFTIAITERTKRNVTQFLN